MGVFSAMLTGVSGLMGQSIKMGAISDNIANVNTVGYKKADVPFQTMVTESMTNTRYAPGGALSRPRILISQQGIITSSNSTTDMAISGRGFFVTSDDTTYSADSSLNYTRAGSFRTAIDPDDSTKALLQNTAGQYLLGWEVDEDGVVSESAMTSTNLNNVDVNRITSTAEATETIGSRMNVPAEVTASADAIGIYGTTSATSDVSNLTFSDTERQLVTVSDTSGGGNILEIATSAGTVGVTFADLAAAFTTITVADGTDGGAAAALYSDNAAGSVITTADLATYGFDNDGTESVSEYVGAVNAAYQALGNTDTLLTLDAAGDTYTFNTTNNGGLVDGEADFSGAGGTDWARATVAGGATTTSLEGLVNALNNLTIAASGTLPSVTLKAEFNSSGQVSISAEDTDGDGQQITAVNLAFGGTLPTDYTLAGSDMDGDPTDATEITGWRTQFDDDNSNTFQVFDALGSSHNVQLQWKKVAGSENLWEVRMSNDGVSGYIGPDGAFDPDSNDGARFVVDTGENAPIQTQRIFMQFNGDGSLKQIQTTADGQDGYTLEGTATSGTVLDRETTSGETPKLVSIAIGPTETASSGEALVTVDETLGDNPLKVFGSDGSPSTAEAIVMEWDLGRPTSLDTDDSPGTGLDGVTQFDSGEAEPIIETFFFEQDGARYGNLSGVTVDEQGLLWANYDNGLSRAIYQLPIATFANADGLIAQSGNIFNESPDSGDVQFRIGGSNGAGNVFGAALEQSNVDLGDEFTNMIITQQAFTANTRTITTSDQMLQELVGILR